MKLKNIIQLFVLCLTMVSMFGCSKLMSPYGDDFSCPQGEEGKCAPVYDAHENALDKTAKNNGGKAEKTFSDNGNISKQFKDVQSESTLDELIAKLEICMKDTDNKVCTKEEKDALKIKIKKEKAGRIEAEKQRAHATQERVRLDAIRRNVQQEYTITPARTEAVIAKVYIAPYQSGQDFLASSRYIYVVLKEPEWVTGGTVIQKQIESGIGTPYIGN